MSWYRSLLGAGILVHTVASFQLVSVKLKELQIQGKPGISSRTDSILLHSYPLDHSSFTMNPQETLDLLQDKNANIPIRRYQVDQLLQLAHLVATEWNVKINLVSRKDCTPQTVWERHILPSVAGISMLNNHVDRAIDVGTGGGFPGLVLAILLPETEFTLLDSVGKKLIAVRAMAQQLGLLNVHTHHERVEEFHPSYSLYEIVLGRSVACIPQFCAWTQHLLQDNGKLLYWTGGDLPELVQRMTLTSRSAREIVSPLVLDSDKRIVELSADTVQGIARESGLLKKKKQQHPQVSTGKRTGRRSKGEWKEKDGPKQRGYENFNRSMFIVSEG